MKPIFELCDVVRQAAYELHVFLGHGHLEKVYQNGLWHRLRRQGVLAIQQHPLVVQDEDGMVLGEYQADLLIEGCLIVEIKACRALVPEHTAQLLGYLRSARVEHGLLINFGSFRFQIEKYVLSRRD
ncbi:MAG TPA: GxxExxY protein [Verrucomicrobiales bacterium]|nr:GxxExxY protein [Verrucomicrobiales bacterium]